MFRDELSAIVADVGAGGFKAGFAGADSPVAWMPTLVGRQVGPAMTGGCCGGGGGGCAGDFTLDVDRPCPGMELRSPFDADGAAVQDWSAMEVRTRATRRHSPCDSC